MSVAKTLAAPEAAAASAATAAQPQPSSNTLLSRTSPGALRRKSEANKALGHKVSATQSCLRELSLWWARDRGWGTVSDKLMRAEGSVAPFVISAGKPTSNKTPDKKAPAASLAASSTQHTVRAMAADPKLPGWCSAKVRSASMASKATSFKGMPSEPAPVANSLPSRTFSRDHCSASAVARDPRSPADSAVPGSTPGTTKPGNARPSTHDARASSAASSSGPPEAARARDRRAARSPAPADGEP
mmetsp:Transcript_31411/g.91758  ORF Transcript_31411/g.91758 Transcript_31411/m.91758 type:complete len:245 (-) Transcript_31411:139-873(-)